MTTAYKAACERLYNQWQAMLNSGKMPIIELQNIAGEWLVFDIDYAQKWNNHCYFYVTGDAQFCVKVNQYSDCLDDYLEVIYNRIISIIGV